MFMLIIRLERHVQKQSHISNDDNTQNDLTQLSS
jgi:hypothetical protein